MTVPASGSVSRVRKSQGHRGNYLRRLNTSAVLRHIFQHPGLSRSEIAAQLGLSAASVTNMTSWLLGAQLLQEGAPLSGTQGRPRVPLQIDCSQTVVMGIHLGPRTTGVVLMSLDGAEQASVLVPHAKKNPVESLDLVVSAAHTLVDSHLAGRKLSGTGIASGGIVDRARGLIIENPAAGWKNVDVAGMLRNRVPSPIIVENNARAAAQSELLYGQGRQTDDFVLLLVTSDIGCVMVDGGRIRSGFRQAAGQIAHLRVSDSPRSCGCCRTGCLAVMASDDAVVTTASEWGLKGYSSFITIFDLAMAGDTVARDLLEERNRYVGRAAAQLIDIHDPELLVVVGGPAEAPLVFEALVDEVGRYAQVGRSAAGRVVLSTDQTFSLALSAASVQVAAILDDPVSVDTVVPSVTP